MSVIVTTTTTTKSEVSNDIDHEWVIVHEHHDEGGAWASEHRSTLWHRLSGTEMRMSIVSWDSQLTYGTKMSFADVEPSFGLAVLESTFIESSVIETKKEILLSAQGREKIITMLAAYSSLPKELLAIVVDYGWSMSRPDDQWTNTNLGWA